MDTLEGLVPLEIAQGIHLNKAGSQGCIGICWRIINQIYEASGNILGRAATQLWNLVRDVVMLHIFIFEHANLIFLSMQIFKIVQENMYMQISIFEHSKI